MLGIPGGAVLVEALFFLRAAVSSAFPCGCQESKVIFRIHGIGEYRYLAAHTLRQFDRAALHIRLGVEMHIQPRRSLPKVKEDDRFLAPHHAVEPDGRLDLAVLPELLEEHLGIWCPGYGSHRLPQEPSLPGGWERFPPHNRWSGCVQNARCKSPPIPSRREDDGLLPGECR